MKRRHCFLTMFLFIFATVFGLISIFPISKVKAETVNTVDTVLHDLLGEPYNTFPTVGPPWRANDAALHGVPVSYDWSGGAKPSTWMDNSGYQSIVMWGQAYEAASESTVTNIRIQVRNMKYYGCVNGVWQLIDEASEDIEGGNYTEDFATAANLSNVRVETNNGGGISFTMVSGYNFHWWVPSWPRAVIPAGTSAFFATAEIRLIPDTDPNVDLSNAKYLASVGMDYYPTPTYVYNGAAPGMAIARHKYITSDWQVFNMYVAGSAPPTSESEYRNLILSIPMPPGVSNGSATPTPTPVTYNEDFNDNLAQNWSLSSGLSVAGSKMSSTGWAASTSAIYNGQSFSPTYSYKVDMYGYGGGVGNIRKVVFNYMDSNNYYFVQFTAGSSGTATLRKKVNGTVSTIASYGTYATNTAWVNVEVNYANGSITVKATKAGMQTTLFNNVSDSSFTSGKVGVMTEYENADFDNVSVTGADVQPTPTPTPTPTPVTYNEDFNDNLAQNWSLSSGVSVAGSKMSSTGWTASTSAIYNGQSFSPTYSYKVDMYGYGGGVGNIRKVVFNYIDSNNYYFVQFTSDSSGTATLRKKVNGTVSTIASYGTYATNTAWVNVEVTYASGGITVKATKAGTQTMLFNNVSDSSFTSGKVGVMTEYENADFDNVSVISSSQPTSTKLEAESATKYGSAANYSDSYASGGYEAAYIDSNGDAVEFTNVPAASLLSIRYSAGAAGKLSLYINNIYSQDVSFASTGLWYGSGAYSTVNVSVSIPASGSVKLQFDSGRSDAAANIDCITVQ